MLSLLPYVVLQIDKTSAASNVAAGADVGALKATGAGAPTLVRTALHLAPPESISNVISVAEAELTMYVLVLVLLNQLLAQLRLQP